MSYYLTFLALTVSKLVIYGRKKDQISHIKKPYGSKNARPLFGMSCEIMGIKKNIALSNVLLHRMRFESIDINRNIAPSNVTSGCNVPWGPLKKGASPGYGHIKR